MTNKELKEVQGMLDIIHAYLSRPRRDRRNETAKRVVEDYMVKYKSLQRLAPEYNRYTPQAGDVFAFPGVLSGLRGVTPTPQEPPKNDKPNWKRFMPSFGWWDKLRA